MPKKQSKKPVVEPAATGPSAAQQWDAQIKSAGGWLGDLVGAPESASAPHSAADDAHTAHPKDSTGWSSMFQGVGDLGRGLQQEGLSALLDPMGVIDRQDAQRDLASRFDVGGLGFNTDGIAQQNDVSVEEFQEIARLYSDIRRGKTSLTIGAGTDPTSPMWDPKELDPKEQKEFEDRTMEDIADILQTTSGRGLIGELANHKKSTTITKSLTEKGHADPNDAAAKDFTYGGGAHEAYVKYAAGETHLPGEGDHRSDVTLFHELTHAYTMLNGTIARGTVQDPGIDQGEDLMEHQATGLGAYGGNQYSENAYRRDRASLSSGNRTLGGKDIDLPNRDTYAFQK